MSQYSNLLFKRPIDISIRRSVLFGSCIFQHYTYVIFLAQPYFLHSTYPLGLESLGMYPLALGLDYDSCEMSYVGFRFGYDIKINIYISLRFRLKKQSAQK